MLFYYTAIFMGLGLTTLGNVLNHALRMCYVKKAFGHTNAKITLGYHWLYDLLIFLVYGLTVFMFMWVIDFDFGNIQRNLATGLS
jgi:hypothetical protein